MSSRPPDRPGDPADRRGPEGPEGPDGPDGTGEWRHLFTGDVRRILANLVEGDPLHVRERCQQRILDRALLVDATRLIAKAYARMAYHAALRRYDGRRGLETWLAARIDQALAELRAEDLEDEMRGIPTSADEAPFYGWIASLAEIEIELARRICLVFNDLPHSVRAPFFRVAVEGRPLEEIASELDVAPNALEQSLGATMRRVIDEALRWGKGGRRP